MTLKAELELCETCRVVRGAIPLWKYHRARLQAGGCGRDVLDRIEREAFKAAATVPNAQPTQRHGVSITARPDGDGLAVLVSRRLSSLDVVGDPVVARVDVADEPPLTPGPAKPADRGWWDAAHRRAGRLGAHQAVIVGADGGIVDGSTASVWIAAHGVLRTPPSPLAIPGVGRAFVLANAERAGLRIDIGRLTWDSFETADEAWLTNAFGGVAAVRGRGGELFERVAALFSEAWAGLA